MTKPNALDYCMLGPKEAVQLFLNYSVESRVSFGMNDKEFNEVAREFFMLPYTREAFKLWGFDPRSYWITFIPNLNVGLKPKYYTVGVYFIEEGSC